MTFTKVTTEGIADSAVSTAKIGANAVDTSKIGADVIVADDIAANAITVAEISDGAVTHAKLHNTMDLTSKTVTLPSLSTLSVDNGTTHAFVTIKGGNSTTNYSGGALLLANPDMDTNYGATHLYHHKAGGSGNQNAGFNISQRTAAGGYVSNIWNVDYQNNAHSFYIPNGGASGAVVLGISSGGHITKPKTPGFFARRTTGGDGRPADTYNEWHISGLSSFNEGNHFNASNGTFTAPITGRYLFCAAPGYKQTNIDYNFYFQINSGDSSEGVRFIGTPLNSHSLATGTVIYNLSANDTVRVRVGYTHHVNTSLNFFMGYLLG